MCMLWACRLAVVVVGAGIKGEGRLDTHLHKHYVRTGLTRCQVMCVRAGSCEHDHWQQPPHHACSSPAPASRPFSLHALHTPYFTLCTCASCNTTHFSSPPPTGHKHSQTTNAGGMETRLVGDGGKAFLHMAWNGTYPGGGEDELYMPNPNELHIITKVWTADNPSNTRQARQVYRRAA